MKVSDFNGYVWWSMDGCKNSWLCVGLNEDDEICSFVEPNIADAFEKMQGHGGKTILIDLPIGLPWDT